MSEGVEMKEIATSEVKVEEQGASLEVVVEKSQPKEENTVENDTEKASSVENKPAEEKIPHYQGDNNPLRSSLCDTFYVNNPDFKEITKTYGFEPVTTIMSKQAIEKQCTIYQKIAESIWNPERLEKIYLEK